MRPGVATASVDGGFVVYVESELHPAAIQAIEALMAVGRVRRTEGDLQVLAAISLGAAIERFRSTVTFAAVVDSYRRSHKHAVNDEQIRAAVQRNRTRDEAAAELGITTRRLYDHCKRLGLSARRNRKSTTSDKT